MKSLEVLVIDEIPEGEFALDEALASLDPAINEGDILDIVGRYQDALEAASAAGRASLDFPAIALFEKPSKNFQYINMIYKTILAFQGSHERPERVRILCPAPEVATMYKQVYNFYYPGTKAERMDDDSWD